MIDDNFLDCGPHLFFVDIGIDRDVMNCIDYHQ